MNIVTGYGGLMSKARTVRFDEKLDDLVDEYADKNGLNFNQLVQYAVKKFITEPNSIELEPVEASDKAWNGSVKKAFAKHKKTMKELG